MGIAINPVFLGIALRQSKRRPLVMQVPANRVDPKAQNLKLFVDALRARGHERFFMIERLEYRTGQQLHTLPTHGTVAHVAVEAFRRAGIEVEENIGSVTDLIGMNREQAHHAFCSCHAETRTGNETADRIESMMRPKRRRKFLGIF